MPEKVFTNVNVEHYDFRRTSVNGATVLIVDMWFLQVRTDVQETFSNTIDPASADPVSSGTVQPTTPTTAQTSAVNGALATAGAH
jgi:hypothetical protein